MGKNSCGRNTRRSRWHRSLLLLMAATVVVLSGCAAPEEEESGPPNPNSADVSVYTDYWGSIAEGIERAVVGNGWEANEAARQSVATALSDTATYFGDWAADGWVDDGDTRVYETLSPERRRWRIEAGSGGGMYFGRLDVDYNGDGSFDDESDYGNSGDHVLNYLFSDFNGLLHLNHPAIGARLSVTENGTSISLSGTTSSGGEISIDISAESNGSSGALIGTLDGVNYFGYEW